MIAVPGRDRAALWVSLAVLGGTLLLAYGGKAVCLDGEPGFWGVTRYCYSDVRVLWGYRGFDVDALPYAGVPPGYPVDYTFEYPPGLAFPAWLIALATDSRAAFFNLHAVTFAAAAVATLWQLERALTDLARTGRPRSRWRLLGFALSPGLVLFGMQNWDLWAVVLVAAGLAAAARRRPMHAAVWFGLGAAVKWWPALLVVTLLVGPWAPRDRGRRLALRPAAVAAGVWALAQLPAVVVSPTAWARSLAFHLERGANLDSAVSALGSVGAELLPGRFWGGGFTTLATVVSLTLLLVGTAYISWRLERGNVDPGDAALALVALFLFTSKVFSPQFVLWLLPVAVLSTVSWTPVLAVEASNAGVWLLYGPWMALGAEPRFAGLLRAAQGMAVVRWATVGWLVTVALGRSAGREHPDQDQGGGQHSRKEPQLAVAHVPGEEA